MVLPFDGVLESCDDWLNKIHHVTKLWVVAKVYVDLKSKVSVSEILTTGLLPVYGASSGYLLPCTVTRQKRNVWFEMVRFEIFY